MSKTKSILNFISNVVDELEDVQMSLSLMGKPEVGSIKPVHPRVLLIIFNPRVPSAGSRKLSEVLKWNDPDELVAEYIEDVKEVSYGFCNYKIVDRIEVDAFPVKADGFSYDGDGFVSAWKARKGFHQPDAVDYQRIIKEFRLVQRVNNDDIDEVWLFAFPYAGFYESIMAGPDAFWCNAPPLKEYDKKVKKRFVIMGFNYERGVGQMLEAHGHRAESIIKYVYRKHRGKKNLWERFTRYDKTHPGQAEVGIVHYAPNSDTDYDWGNKKVVMSRCDNWLNFPDLSGPARKVDCSDWGHGNIREHHHWWFKRFPHVAGESDGVSHNWWEYVTDPNLVR